LIRNLFVLPFRPYKTARGYRRIWTDDGSPLVAMGRHQAADLEWQLGQRIDRPVPVFTGMRYGKPSISAALGVLRRRGCRKILVLPLYPQYSATTTASAFDEVFREITTWRRVPELRTVAGYHDHPAYIGALVSSIYDVWKDGGNPHQLLVSFHGLPTRYIEAGDPYEDRCRATAALIKARLEFDSGRIDTVFQSRFGREKWTEPYLTNVLRELGKAKLPSLDIVCPGFAADCLETLDEIGVAASKIFTKAGGGTLRYIPALGRRPDHIAALAEISIEHLGGWIV
jgi:ferrochelatase